MARLLRMYPGEKDFREVSRKEWDAPFRHVADWKGYGVIATMEASLSVFDKPGGDLVVAKKWPSRSYIRNFARVMRNMFSENAVGGGIDFVDKDAVARRTQLQDPGSTSGGLLPEVPVEATAPGLDKAPYSGAGFGVGDGVAAEDHTRNDLVNRFGQIIDARNFVRTSVLTTATITLEITGAITNSSSATLNVTEIGMFGYFRRDVDLLTRTGFWTLLAYDGVTSTPVAVGGVAAPRYTLNYPV